MATAEITPKERVEAALREMQESIKDLERAQNEERDAYERGIAPAVAQFTALKEQNPKAKKFPLQEGQRTGYNIVSRVLDEALRERSISERASAFEFVALLKVCFGPPA